MSSAITIESIGTTIMYYVMEMFFAKCKYTMSLEQSQEIQKNLRQFQAIVIWLPVSLF